MRNWRHDISRNVAESGHTMEFNEIVACNAAEVELIGYFWNIARNVARNNFNSGHTVQFKALTHGATIARNIARDCFNQCVTQLHHCVQQV